MEVEELMNPSVVTIEIPTPPRRPWRRAGSSSRHNVGPCRCARGGPAAAWDGHRPGYCTAVCGGGGEPGPDAGAGHYDPGLRVGLPRMTAGEATRLMSVQQVRRLPVVEDGRLVGIVSLADLARSQRFGWRRPRRWGRSRKISSTAASKAGQRPGRDG